MVWDSVNGISLFCKDTTERQPGGPWNPFRPLQEEEQKGHWSLSFNDYSALANGESDEDFGILRTSLFHESVGVENRIPLPSVITRATDEERTTKGKKNKKKRRMGWEDLSETNPHSRLALCL